MNWGGCGLLGETGAIRQATIVPAQTGEYDNSKLLDLECFCLPTRMRKGRGNPKHRGVEKGEVLRKGKRQRYLARWSDVRTLKKCWPDILRWRSRGDNFKKEKLKRIIAY